MIITRDNYEAFLLDRLEGNLSDELNQELELFMVSNPDLHIPSEEFVQISSSASLSPTDKATLKKTLPPSGIELNSIPDLLIAKLEGDLSEQQLQWVDQKIASDKHVAQEWKLTRATKSVVSNTKYEAKGELKRGAKVIPLYRYLSIAASLILLLGLTWLFTPATKAPLANIEKAESVTDEINPTPKLEQAEKEISADTPSNKLPDVEISANKHTQSVSVKSTSRSQSDPIDNFVTARTEGEIARETMPLLDTRRYLPKSSIESAQLLTASAEKITPEVVAPKEKKKAYTVSEFIAHLVRKNIINERNSENTGDLNGEDALAMVDRGLENISNGNSHVSIEQGKGRRLLDLRLGSLDLRANMSK